MAVPKRKTTPSARNQRRAHDGLSSKNYKECDNCGELILPHHLCSHCGHYKKTEIIAIKDDADLDSDED